MQQKFGNKLNLINLMATAILKETQFIQ